MMPTMPAVIPSKHTQAEIVLQPKNPEFSPIVIHEDEADEFRVIGEFVGCLPKAGMSRDPQ